MAPRKVRERDDADLGPGAAESVMSALASRLIDGGQRFLHWWGGQLHALVPAPIAQLVRGADSRLMVDFSVTPATVHRIAGGREGERFAIAPGMSATEIGDAIARCGHHREVHLRLAAGRGLCRRVELPLAAEENLDEVLGFEMERLTPFVREEVLFAHDIVARDREAGSLVVDLKVAPYRVIEEARSRLPDTIGPIGRIEVAGRNTEDPVIHIDLPGLPTSSGRLHHRINAALALTLLVLAGLWVHRQESASADVLAALEARKDELRDAVDNTLALQADVDRLLASRSLLHEKREASPLVVALLDDITARLPDHSWLTMARLSRGAIHVTGYSAAVPELVSAFAASPLFSGVTFASPVTRDPKRGLDRFHLGLVITEAAIVEDKTP